MASLMGFHVICLSYTDGAGGERVGHAVAEKLGFRYVNEEIILEASRLARVDPKLVAATEQKQTFLQRLLESLSSAQQSLGPAALAAGLAVPIAPEIVPHKADKDDLRSMIRAVIHEVAKSGNAVIVAHAASFALAGKDGVLRVLLTAPNETRAGRIAAERKLSGTAAASVIEKGDEGRREYLRAFYEVEEETATRYDLVVNTEILTPEEATVLIVCASAFAA
jgi:cytidylate kinase